MILPTPFCVMERQANERIKGLVLPHCWFYDFIIDGEHVAAISFDDGTVEEDCIS